MPFMSVTPFMRMQKTKQSVSLLRLLLGAAFLTLTLAQKIEVGSRDDSSSHHVRTILLKFYESTNGLDWKDSTNWFAQGVSVCEWFGVDCYTASTTTDARRVNHIREIQLNDNDLVGIIPSEIWELPYLQRLNVKGNDQLEVSWNNLVAAQFLTHLLVSDTSVDNLQGIGAAESLQVLHVTDLGFDGTIPVELYDLTKLESLFMNYNHFSGTLSTLIGQLTQLNELYLYDNDLTGDLPTELGLLTDLDVLTLGQNAFGGSIPTQLQRLTHLQVLSVQRKAGLEKGPGIDGPLPTFQYFSKLEQLLLENQKLSGEIDRNFLLQAPSTRRIQVNLSNNQLVGSLPGSLTDKAYLNLYLADNQLDSVSSKYQGDCPNILNWMDGSVENVGCSAFLCPPQTFAPFGRATTSDACEPCGTDKLVWGQTTCDASSATNERQVLIDMYNKMNGPNWDNNNNWLDPSASVCDWFGVACDGADMVESINLEDNGLTGTPPSTLLALQSLKFLNLSANSIQFEFANINAPSLETLTLSSADIDSLDGLETSNFPKLRGFSIATNLIGGSIPGGVFTLTQLEELYLSNCRFTGTLSTRIGELVKLKYLSVGGNVLTGQIPPQLGNLPELRSLLMSENRFEGTLPPEFDNLRDLAVLSIHQSSFSEGGIGGTLPSFRNMEQLATVYLNANRLVGNLPPDFLQNSRKDSIQLNLNDNQLEGEIPSGWSRFEQLNVDLTENKITGIASNLCSKAGWMDGQVASFNCDAILCPSGKYNEIGRRSDADHPCLDCAGAGSLLGSTQCDSTGEGVEESEFDILREFFMKTHGPQWLDQTGWGPSPQDYCNEFHGITCDVSGRVTKIVLMENGLTGTAPSSIFRLERLQEVYLTRNQLSISLEGIEQATNLKVLHLGNTRMDSVDGIGKATSLINLDLSDNGVEGSVPSEIFLLTNLRELYLSTNHLSGRFPEDMQRLSNLEKLYMYHNRLTGQLPGLIGNMQSLVELNLAENNFDGTIPTEINKLSNLVFLSLQREGGVHGTTDVGIFHDESDALGPGLSGPLPSFDKLPKIRELYLGLNSLTGPVPFNFLDEIDDKTDSIRIDITSNRISGTLPASLTQFDHVSFFLGGNRIVDIADGICIKNNWMQGAVGSFGCDAIMCPVGMHNLNGRKISDSESCDSCTTGTSGFMGSFECLTADEHQDNTERGILERLYTEMQGNEWYHRDNWMDPDVSVCLWYGITCESDTEQTIKSIQLSHNRLRHILPTEIYTLPDLQQLDISQNGASISFDGIQNAVKLEYLDISETFTEGLAGVEQATNLKVLNADDITIEAFPTNIFSLNKLEVLSLNENKFTSQALPTQLQNFVDLVYFACSECGFTGPIPTWINEIQTLEYLRLDQNAFDGSLPTEIESLPNLKHLDLGDQKSHGGGISGGLPAFANQPDLVELYLQYNNLEGEIPPDFLANSKNDGLIVVNLRANGLSGAIPVSLAFLNELDISLAANQISEIPSAICNTNWNDGSTTQHECDGILCNKGTWNSYGRAFGTLECFPCDESSSLVFGSVTCGSNFEHNILVLFYRSLGGPNWKDDTNWLRTEDYCTWNGITCHEVGEYKGLVKDIDLPDNNLEGSPNLQLFQLAGLMSVNLKQNNIELSFFFIENAQNLQTLILSETSVNSLQHIGGGQSLKSIHLTNSKVAGPLPDELYSLINLEELYLSYNEITGSLSTLVGSLQSLRDLYMFGNEITGSLPSELGSLTSIRHLSLGENRLVGTIPQQVLNLRFLEVLSLQREKSEACASDSGFCGTTPGGLTGSLPGFQNLLNLQQLFLAYNAFTGTIPRHFLLGVQDRSSLMTIDLSHNTLGGIIPEELADFDNMRIYLAGNDFGSLPTVFCEKGDWMEGQVAEFGCNAILCPLGFFNEFGRQINVETECKECSYPDSANALGSTTCGPVGLDKYDDAAILYELYDATGGDGWTNKKDWRSDTVSFCDWFGVQCEPAGDLGSMTVTAIDLDENNMDGIIPSILFHLPALKRLSVRGNEIEIGFKAIHIAEDLEELYLDDTRVDSLNGIEQAVSLKVLHLQRNQFVGFTIPEKIFSLSALVDLDLTGSRFTGTLSSNLGILSNLESLSLAGNELRGSIPSEIGNMVALRSLDLSGNNIFGTLPESIANLEAMESFKIDNTGRATAGITGPLPAFRTMAGLTELNLAQNQLTGSIPQDFLGAVEDQTSAEINVYLQGNHLIGSVPATLTRLPKLNIELADNLLVALGDGVCDQSQWLGGAVGSYGCDAILCRPGHFAPQGRQTSETETCGVCPGSEHSLYFGASTCRAIERFREREILESLYTATGGDNWKNRDGWMDDSIDVCAWNGISCKDEDYVESIVLGSNRLTGTPPTELMELKHLKNLWLYSNPISFNFGGIEQATNLRSLLLDSTKLNSLSGIGNAKNLVDLDVRFNQLGGKIPTDIENLLELETLSFADNSFSGTVPSFSRLTKLKTLRMGSNRLDGKVPSFSTLALLTTLDLSDNKLKFSIPNNLLNRVDIASTVFLDLSGNAITGTIPVELERFEDLTIYLRNNKIEGIPPSLCDKAAWNGGDVNNFQCDGILCPSGSYSTSGRASRSGQSCEPCPSNPYFGATSCEPPRSSASWLSFSLIVPAILAACAGLLA